MHKGIAYRSQQKFALNSSCQYRYSVAFLVNILLRSRLKHFIVWIILRHAVEMKETNKQVYNKHNT